ncbi:MAG: DNA ligase D [Betaproteobacteria bacterium]
MKATDPLATYKQKRDFGITPEPADAEPEARAALSFVIQKHAARRLHYDFRLELDGTLKSWAVPKGPSFDPTQKRMAVHVEDHPLSYASFEGVIPPKQYGAGTVIVWDRGWWEPIGDPRKAYREGHMKFRLHGEKLNGAWALVRMRNDPEERQEHWLLIKERDESARPEAEYSVVEALPDSVLKSPLKPAGGSTLPAGAKKAALPDQLAPQLATLVERVPGSDQWSYELKFDGYRILARIDGNEVRLITRNGNDWTAKLPELAAAVAELKLDSAWLDGEIVVLDAEGKPDFGALQNAFGDERTAAVRYFVFDLPFHGGYDLRPVPLAERRKRLESLLRQAPERIRFSADFEASGHDILQNACRLKLEGIIGKRVDRPYISGRSNDWIKLKCTQRQEFVIVGYSDPQGSRVGFGALLLAVHDEAGRLRYAGRVGAGFDDTNLAALKKKLAVLAVDRTPLFEPPKEARGHWVKPQLVAEVSFAGWTKEGVLRHSVFHGLRDDKPVSVIIREAPSEPSNEKTNPPVKPAATKSRQSAAPTIAGLRITHPERVIDTSTGLTKLGLATYYQAAAKHMLPHLARRPVAVIRAPDGIGGELFFQKHGEAAIPGAKQLDPAFDPGHPPLLEIASVEALIGAVQMNVIEFHTWNATTRHIEKPDRVTFDLDPGEGVPWTTMQDAAQLVHAFLDELGLKSFLKTSGGKGLHVVVPLTPREEWDAVKDFSKAVTEHLATVLPGRFSAKSGPRNRVGKIFVDYLRNGRGATTVAAFSARARPGMGVSIPCAWDELPTLTGGAHWTVATAEERLTSADDPWADYAKTKQTLTAARKKLMPLK